MIKDYKQIEGFPNYYINKNGEVIKYIKGKMKILNTRLNAYGYPRVSMIDEEGNRKDRLVHILVAKAFIDNPNNYKIINHKNGNKEDFSIKNLEWCTQKYNLWHSRNVLGNEITDDKECYLFYRGKYIGEFRSKEKAIEYCYQKYGVSKQSLRKHFTSNGCALILKETVTTIPKGSSGE